ncbi:unnamed protein product [Rhizophagus irregularis]|nr:unnamed protein product [Rhizophagus irregularis]
MANKFLGSVCNQIRFSKRFLDFQPEHSLVMLYLLDNNAIKVFYGGLFPFEQDNCLLVIKEDKRVSLSFKSQIYSTKDRLNKVLKSRYLKSAICDPRLRK